MRVLQGYSAGELEVEEVVDEIWALDARHGREADFPELAGIGGVVLFLDSFVCGRATILYADTEDWESQVWMDGRSITGRVGRELSLTLSYGAV